MCIHISQSHPTKNIFYTTSSPLFGPVYHYRWSGNQRQAKDGWENFLGAFESFEALLQIVLVSVHRFITYTYMCVRVCVIVCVRVFLCVCVREGVGSELWKYVCVCLCPRNNSFLSQKYLIYGRVRSTWEPLINGTRIQIREKLRACCSVVQCVAVRCSVLQRNCSYLHEYTIMLKGYWDIRMQILDTCKCARLETYMCVCSILWVARGYVSEYMHIHTRYLQVLWVCL